MAFIEDGKEQNMVRINLSRCKWKDTYHWRRNRTSNIKWMMPDHLQNKQQFNRECIYNLFVTNWLGNWAKFVCRVKVVIKVCHQFDVSISTKAGESNLQFMH